MSVSVISSLKPFIVNVIVQPLAIEIVRSVRSFQIKLVS